MVNPLNPECELVFYPPSKLYLINDEQLIKIQTVRKSATAFTNLTNWLVITRTRETLVMASGKLYQENS